MAKLFSNKSGFSEWERSGNKTAKERLLNSMQTIAAQPNGFFTGSAAMELATGKFQHSPPSKKTIRNWQREPGKNSWEEKQVYENFPERYVP